MNTPEVEALALNLARQYYTMFDSDRAKVIDLFAPDAMFTFGNLDGMGHGAIRQVMEKIGRVVHNPMNIRSHQTADGGVIAVIDGTIKIDENPPLAYHETLVVKKILASYFIQHAIFKLSAL